MAGGFLSGLGQGLQRASGTVADFTESRRQQVLQQQREKEFQLSHELAQKEFGLRQNQAGVDEMMAQHKADMDEQSLDVERTTMENQNSYNRNRLGLDEMGLMNDARNQEVQAGLERDRNASYRIMANNSGGGGGQDRYYDVQRIIAAMSAPQRELDSLQGSILPGLGADEATNSRIEQLRMILDTYQNEIQRSMGMGQVPALNQALQGGNPQPGATLSSPDPRAIQQNPLNQNSSQDPRQNRRPNPNQVRQTPF